MNEKLLFIDTETGGLNPKKNTLLSIGLVVWDNGEIKASKEILIDNNSLKFTAQRALGVNMIELDEHDKKALTEQEAKVEFMLFLESNFDLSKCIILAGHNVSFDAAFLKSFLGRNGVPASEFRKLFSYRVVDTVSILYFLYLARYRESKLLSTDAAFEEFQIDSDNRHTALGDALSTAKLFSKLIDIVESNHPMVV